MWFVSGRRCNRYEPLRRNLVIGTHRVYAVLGAKNDEYCKWYALVWTHMVLCWHDPIVDNEQHRGRIDNKDRVEVLATVTDCDYATMYEGCFVIVGHSVCHLPSSSADRVSAI